MNVRFPFVRLSALHPQLSRPLPGYCSTSPRSNVKQLRPKISVSSTNGVIKLGKDITLPVGKNGNVALSPEDKKMCLVFVHRTPISGNRTRFRVRVSPTSDIQRRFAKTLTVKVLVHMSGVRSTGTCNGAFAGTERRRQKYEQFNLEQCQSKPASLQK